MSTSLPRSAVETRDRRRSEELTQALRELLDSVGNPTTPPLAAFDASGRLIGRGGRQRTDCGLVQSGQGLEPTESGEWVCPLSSCARHSRFRREEVSIGGESVQLVQCGGTNDLDLIAELVRDSLSSRLDHLPILDELTRVYEEINWLYGLGDILEKELDESSTFVEIFRYVAELLPVEGGEIWVPDEENSTYRCLVRCVDGQVARDFGTVDRSPDTDSLLQGVGTCVVRESGSAGGPAQKLLQALCKGVGRPAIALPMETKSQFQGLLLFGLQKPDYTLNAPELKLLAAIARQTSLCLRVYTLIEELRANEGLKREIEIAREIQHGLFPQRLPQHARYDLYGGCVTAARVGGDYYDYFERDSELCMLIADVSGHSVASGLISMSFRSSFRHHIAEGVRMEDLFSKVNRSLYDELHLSGHFLSAFHCTLCTESGRVRFVNAGHNPPFVYRSRQDRFEELTESGLLIGVLRNTEYPIGELTLEPGDVMVLYTDGIVEAENQHHDVYGTERLMSAVRKYVRRSSKQLYHYLLRDMYVFQDEYFNKDDVTVLVLKMK